MLNRLAVATVSMGFLMTRPRTLDGGQDRTARDG